MKFSLSSLFAPDPKKGWTKEAVVRAGLALTVIVGGTILALSLIAGAWNAITGERMYNEYGLSQNTMGYDTDAYYGGVYMEEPAMAPAPATSSGMRMAEESFIAADYGAKMYSSYYPYTDNGGMYAEEFEQTSYYAFFDTRLFNETCTAIASLKPLNYVLFDYASENDSYCSYEFRVEEAYAPTVADAIRALYPDDFSANTATVAQTIKSQESERAYLERRLESLESTRAEAEDAYESLLEKAVTKGSVAELANVVNSRLHIIERLTQDIQTVEEQLERLDATQTDTLEETLYEHFSVQVQKRVLIDWETMKNDWHDSLSMSVINLNKVFVLLTLGLLEFVTHALVSILFIAIIVLGMVAATKYMRIAIQYIWKDL